MSEMTYTRCPACRGSTWLHGEGVGGATLCPCTRGDTPGWAPTGVTLAQLDRMAETERALAGDPGVPPARRRKALARAWAALSREDARPAAAEDASAREARRRMECPGYERGSQGVPCCDRAGEYNGYGSDGPWLFYCPKGCGCHD